MTQGAAGPKVPRRSHRRRVCLWNRIDAEFLADMGERHRIGEAAVGHHRAQRRQPGLSVKSSRGQCWVVSIRISPRASSPVAGNGSFGWPA